MGAKRDILAILQEQKTKFSDIRRKTGYSEVHVWRALSELEAENLVRKLGDDSGWEILPEARATVKKILSEPEIDNLPLSRKAELTQTKQIISALKDSYDQLYRLYEGIRRQKLNPKTDKYDMMEGLLRELELVREAKVRFAGLPEDKGMKIVRHVRGRPVYMSKDKKALSPVEYPVDLEKVDEYVKGVIEQLDQYAALAENKRVRSLLQTDRTIFERHREILAKVFGGKK